MMTSSQGVRPLLAIIDYGMGNLRSVVRAWEHVGATTKIVSAPDEIEAVDALVFPGQGAIVDAMHLLRETGFDNTIRDWIAGDKPFFGICLGLQALFDYSEEGNTKALSIFKGNVRRFDVKAPLKVPHMGWNSITFTSNDLITNELTSGQDQFYFVHSYFVEPLEKGLILFETDYGGRFVSGICSGKCYATQFHPEKSQAKGLQLYSNFLKLL